MKDPARLYSPAGGRHAPTARPIDWLRPRAFTSSHHALGWYAEQLCQMPVEQFMEFAGSHNVPLHYGANDLEEDRRTLERLGL